MVKISIAGSCERKIYPHDEKDRTGTFFYRFSGISDKTGHGEGSEMADDFHSNGKVP